MPAIALGYTSQLSVTRTQDGPYVGGGDNTTTVNGMNRTESLNGSSTVPVTKDAAFRLTLSSGSGTIDFRNLPDPDLGAVDGNGLRVQALKLRNKSDNANDITVAKGASNGWTGLGSAFSVTLGPDQEVTFYLDDRAPDISATVKTLDVTGTGSQVLEVQVVMG